LSEHRDLWEFDGRWSASRHGDDGRKVERIWWVASLDILRQPPDTLAVS
jgi:hypothetical protein